MRPHLYAGGGSQGLRADHHLHYAAVVDVTGRAHQLQDVGGGVVVSEEDQSVYQTRHAVLWKLVVNLGADQPLDVEECESALVYSQAVPVDAHLEGEAGGLRHLPPLQSAMKEMEGCSSFQHNFYTLSSL